MLPKFKSFLANDLLFYSVLLILIAVGSFGLGRLSVSATKVPEKPLFLKENITSASVVNAVPAATASTSVKAEVTTVSKTAAVVGSKSGTKYHLPNCPGAKRIKPANLISFETIDAAKAAGYTPAANCPGLQ